LPQDRSRFHLQGADVLSLSHPSFHPMRFLKVSCGLVLLGYQMDDDSRARNTYKSKYTEFTQ